MDSSKEPMMADSLCLDFGHLLHKQKQQRLCLEKQNPRDFNSGAAVNLGHMPNEILLQIFSHLPIDCLLMAACKVNRSWRYFAYTFLHQTPLIFDKNTAPSSPYRQMSNTNGYFEAANHANCNVTEFDTAKKKPLSCTLLSIMNMHCKCCGGCRRPFSSLQQWLSSTQPTTAQNIVAPKSAQQRFKAFVEAISSATRRETNIACDLNGPISGFPLAHFVCNLDLGKAQRHHTIDITHSTVRLVLENCLRLRHLSLAGCFQLTDCAFSGFSAAPLSGLRTVNLSDCTAVTDESIDQLTRYCPNLSVLNLNGCIQLTNRGVAMIAERLKKLRKIRFHGCYRLSDDSLTNLASSASLAKCLEWIDVGECIGLSAAGISLLSTFSQLLWLDISHSQTKLYANTSNYHENSFMKSDLVSEIQLDHNIVTFDDAVMKIVDNCKSLELLDLSHVTEITDRSLCHVGRNARNLKSLALKGLPLITSESILQLGELRRRYRRLIWLQIYNCRHINGTVIDEMIRRLNDGWRKGPYDTSVHRDVMNGQSWEDIC